MKRSDTGAVFASVARSDDALVRATYATHFPLQDQVRSLRGWLLNFLCVQTPLLLFYLHGLVAVLWFEQPREPLNYTNILNKLGAGCLLRKGPGGS